VKELEMEQRLANMAMPGMSIFSHEEMMAMNKPDEDEDDEPLQGKMQYYV
jgi:hypothetical protein